MCSQIHLTLVEVKRRTPSLGLVCVGLMRDEAEAHRTWDWRWCCCSSSSSPLLSSPLLSAPHTSHLTPHTSHLTSPHLTSPHLTSPHLTSPHLTSHDITRHHITSHHCFYDSSCDISTAALLYCCGRCCYLLILLLLLPLHLHRHPAATPPLPLPLPLPLPSPLTSPPLQLLHATAWGTWALCRPSAAYGSKDQYLHGRVVRDAFIHLHLLQDLPPRRHALLLILFIP